MQTSSGPEPEHPQGVSEAGRGVTSSKALIEGKADPLLRDRSQGLTALDFAQRGRDWDAGPNEEAIKAEGLLAGP